MKILMLIGISIALILSISVISGEAPSNPHGNLKWECGDCHTTESWKAIKPSSNFKHEDTGFSLQGAHTSVSCIDCHNNLAFANTPSACADCHTDVHQGQFGNNCDNCHMPFNWQNRQDIINIHSSRGFPLIGVHAMADCQACHINQQQNEYAGTPIECSGCHIDNFNSASDPNHTLAGFSSDCRTCHSAVSTNWKNANYQHPSIFVLHGAHLNLDCVRCHASSYAGTPPECNGCHSQDYQASTNPPHAALQFPIDCTICHSDVQWNGATFNHVQASGFDLVGAHANLHCGDCHTNNRWTGIPTNCYGCHQANFEAVTNPNHVTNNFSHDCTQCHTNVAWTPAAFDHAQAGFPLTGGHASVQCIACHANGYQNTSPVCFSCHEANFNSASNPNHVTNQFSHDCTQCHTIAGWSPATFDHANTNFPLTGAHVSLQCITCHANGYQNTPADCYSCHQSNYNSVTDPNHVTNAFSHDCTQCHNTTAWNPATFDHANTNFPLTGAHVSLQCIACHANGYQNTPTDCYSCHVNDFNGVTDPNHVTNNFSHDCTLCHNTTSWSNGIFDHGLAGFPLTGGHANLQCIACHADGYQNTSPICYGCHATDYNSVTDPNHVTNNFSQDCTQCHTINGWSPATFDHSGTRFPLTGAHVSLQCIACHANGYQNTPYDCYSCHTPDFNGVTDPNHVTNNFSHDCTQCHSTSAWNPATFDHSGTRFPLTGAHVGLQCIACHANGYQNTPYDCYSCHVNDYNGVTDPNHVQLAFSHDCTQCHTTNAWDPATFDHSQTQFPLTGAHLTVPCVSCHANGYQNTPTDCYACHAADYGGASNPPHASMGFPTNCVMCHTTSGWIPSTFNHDSQYFPIFSGSHQGRWTTCADCHIIPNDFVSFECIYCHTHNRTDTDQQHQGVPGYVYLSSACYSCHPTGGGGGLLRSR